MQLKTNLSSDIGDIIRSIEQESGKATQVIIANGDVKYLIADLTKRQGHYRVELDDTYDNFPESKISPVPNQELAGKYTSFDVIKKSFQGKELVLMGDKVTGFSIGVYLFNAGRGGGSQYSVVGKIVYPLLQKDEKVEVEELE